MTEEDYDLVFEVADQWWRDFSTLVNRALEKVPEHCREELETIISEKSSVYGRDEKL